MKKLLIIICGFLVAVSCNNLEGPDGTGAQNPLNECVLPSIVQAGEEALIQWNGFTQSDRIYLIDENGQETEVSIKVLTDSGIMFVVPKSLPEGTYVLVIEQNGRKELGTIVVTAADMPVSGIKVPSSGTVGEEITIEGIGFEDGCSVILKGMDGKEHLIKTTIVASGISILISEDIAQGNYTLYLMQEGMMWQISTSFAVYGKAVEKHLRRIDYLTPYSGESKLKVSWEINREAPASLTLSESVIEGTEETLQAYDLYESDADGKFNLTHDGLESSNDIAMSYTRNSDGVVTQSDILIYGHKQTTPFIWTYDADGYLTDISSPSISFRSMTYTDGNLTAFRNTSFEYGDSELVNHPSAPDVVWTYMAVMEGNDPFVYFPYLLGWYTKSSILLPTEIVTPDPIGNGTVTSKITYNFDEDGYVIKISWDVSEIYFIY